MRAGVRISECKICNGVMMAADMPFADTNPETVKDFLKLEKTGHKVMVLTDEEYLTCEFCMGHKLNIHDQTKENGNGK